MYCCNPFQHPGGPKPIKFNAGKCDLLFSTTVEDACDFSSWNPFEQSKQSFETFLFREKNCLRMSSIFG